MIVEHYGVKHQLIQLAEECGELATASLHFRRSKIDKEQFTTEVADVMVMIEQMIQCGFIEEDDLYRLTLYKTERQLERIRRGIE